MLYILTQCGRLVYSTNVLLLKNHRLTNIIRPHSYFVNYTSVIKLCSAGRSKDCLVSSDQSSLVLSRHKHGSRKIKQGKHRDEESSDEEDEEENDDDDDLDEMGTDSKTFSVKSLRVDAILKAGLGISRKRIEEAFYENKIRLNGKIVQKKSQNANLSDEIDLIKGFAGEHSDSVVVGRIKILKVKADSDTGNIVLKAWRNKSLRIDNFQDNNAWRDPGAE